MLFERWFSWDNTAEMVPVLAVLRLVCPRLAVSLLLRAFITRRRTPARTPVQGAIEFLLRNLFLCFR